MATHSTILAWEIQWTEEPGGLQNTRGFASWWGCKTVARDLVTKQ